jgi:hypothetical protein
MKMKRKMSLEVISTETDSVKVGDTFTVAVGLIKTPTIKVNKLDGTGDGPNKPKGPKKPKQPTIKEMLGIIMTRLDRLETQFNEFKRETNLKFEELRKEMNLKFDEFRKEMNLKFEDLKRDNNLK